MRTVGLILGVMFLALGTLQIVLSSPHSTVLIAGAILYAGATIAEAIVEGAKRKDVT